MEVIIQPLFSVILAALKFYEIIVIVAVVMGWLFHFNVINYSNQLVKIIWDICYRLTEPLLMRIRRFLPELGGLDLSPIVLLLLVFFAQGVVAQLAHKLI